MEGNMQLSIDTTNISSVYRCSHIYQYYKMHGSSHPAIAFLGIIVQTHPKHGQRDAHTGCSAVGKHKTRDTAYATG